MKKLLFIFIAIVVAVNIAFPQLNPGSPFESWSNSIKFDQFNEDHIKIIGSSDFESWTNSHRFVHFFDEPFAFSPMQYEVNTVQKNSETPEASNNSESENSSQDNQLLIDNTDNLISSKINIYPNPATDRININLNLNSYSDVEITLFNSIGNIVYNALVKDKKQILKSINVETINRGIYFLEIKSDGKKTIKKIIIK